MKDKGIIYKITSPSGKVYIGQTINGIDYRWKQHIKNAQDPNKRKCRIIYNAIIKYGEKNMKKEILCECNVNQLDEKENEYINLFNSLSPNGYNMRTNKEEHKRGIVTQEFKDNVSHAVLNYYKTNPQAEKSREKIKTAKLLYHKNNIITHTNESKNKISNSLKKYYKNNQKDYNFQEDNLPRHFKSIKLIKNNEEHDFINISEAGKYLNVDRKTVRRHIDKEYKGYLIKRI